MSRGVHVAPNDANEDVDFPRQSFVSSLENQGSDTGSGSCETVDNARSVGIETHNLVSVASTCRRLSRRRPER